MHAQGSHSHKPHWAPIRDAYFASTPSPQVLPPDLTIITCNNGHPAMGCFERSLQHMGLECTVVGRGISPWVNSRDKPRLIAKAAREATTEFMLYADSRDALLIHPPRSVLDRFQSHFSCELLFGGDRLSYPPNPQWRRHEDSLEGASRSEFRYLNAGAWIGRTKYVAEFFERACRCEPLLSAPESEQGIIRDLLPSSGNRVAIDYFCDIFVNIGYLFAPQIRIHKPKVGAKETGQ